MDYQVQKRILLVLPKGDVDSPAACGVDNRDGCTRSAGNQTTSPAGTPPCLRRASNEKTTTTFLVRTIEKSLIYRQQLLSWGPLKRHQQYRTKTINPMKQHFVTEHYDHHCLKPPIVAPSARKRLAVFSKNYQKLSTYITGINGLKDCRVQAKITGTPESLVHNGSINRHKRQKSIFKNKKKQHF